MQRCIQSDTAARPSANTHTRGPVRRHERVDSRLRLPLATFSSLRCLPHVLVRRISKSPLGFASGSWGKDERRRTWIKTRVMGQKEKKISCVSAECLSNDAIHQIPDSVASLKNGHGLGCAHPPRAGNEPKRNVQTYWYHRDRPRAEGDATLALVSPVGFLSVR